MGTGKDGNQNEGSSLEVYFSFPLKTSPRCFSVHMSEGEHVPYLCPLFSRGQPKLAGSYS